MASAARTLSFLALLPACVPATASVSRRLLLLPSKPTVVFSGSQRLGRGGAVPKGTRRSQSTTGLFGGVVRGGLLGCSGSLAMAVTAEESSGNGVAVAEKKVGVSQSDGTTLDDLLTEFMVDMSCEGCVKSVRRKLEPLEGVKSVDVDLANEVVRVLGSASIKNMISAIEQSGRDARLVGQGLPSNFVISAAVAEFKGPEVNGVVRFAQVTMELAKIDASFSGLSPGSHAWSINTYGDLTQGAASTGEIFDEASLPSLGSKNKPLGHLGTLEVNSNGDAVYFGTKAGLLVSELIGRSVVLYENQDTSENGITAAVIARSAGVGENYKRLCTCDGTVIWESSNNDFVKL